MNLSLSQGVHISLIASLRLGSTPLLSLTLSSRLHPAVEPDPIMMTCLNLTTHLVYVALSALMVRQLEDSTANRARSRSLTLALIHLTLALTFTRLEDSTENRARRWMFEQQAGPRSILTAPPCS